MSCDLLVQVAYLFVLQNSPITGKFQTLLWGEYGYFPEVRSFRKVLRGLFKPHKMFNGWRGEGEERIIILDASWNNVS